MSDSNVAELAALQQHAASSQAPSGRDSEEILRDLGEIGNDPDLAQIESLTAELAGVLSKAKRLAVAMSREKYIRSLTGKLHAPARLFDNALADSGTSSATMADPEQGRALAFENPEPWPESVDGAAILAELRAVFQRFVVLGEADLTVLALWVMHTFAFEVAWITPRLAITSPEKRCGKTLVLTLLRYLVAKPLMTANASPAAIFRSVEKVRPTLLIDEADTFLRSKDDLRGILNSGNQKDGSVLRTVGDDHEPRAFSTFSPCAIAMIGQLPDTLADRSIAVRMARKKPDETVERLRTDRLGSFKELRRRAMRWAIDTDAVLAQADPEVPGKLNDRAADNWRTLLAIADASGSAWPQLARKAAIEASSSKDEDSSARTQLLDDLRSMFERRSVDRIFSFEIVEELTAMEERPWPEWKAGKPLTVRQLATLLKPFDVRPRQVRIGDDTAKGYRLEDLRDAFERYLGAPIRNIRNISLESKIYDEVRSETSGRGVSDREWPKTPGSSRVVSDVSDREEATDADLREVVEL